MARMCKDGGVKGLLPLAHFSMLFLKAYVFGDENRHFHSAYPFDVLDANDMLGN